MKPFDSWASGVWLHPKRDPTPSGCRAMRTPRCPDVRMFRWPLIGREPILGTSANEPASQQDRTLTPPLVKATFDLTPELVLKLEQVRLDRMQRGEKVDTSALVREARDTTAGRRCDRRRATGPHGGGPDAATKHAPCDISPSQRHCSADLQMSAGLLASAAQTKSGRPAPRPTNRFPLYHRRAYQDLPRRSRHGRVRAWTVAIPSRRPAS